MSAEPVSSPLPEGVPAETAAIRGQLGPELATIFDREWEIVLEAAKLSHDLAGINDLLIKWRHVVAAESREPGWYFRLQEDAAGILERGTPDPDAVSGDEVRAMIAARLRASTPGN